MALAPLRGMLSAMFWKCRAANDQTIHMVIDY